MKKSIGIFILTLFLVSLVPVFADDSTGDTVRTDAKTIIKDKIKEQRDLREKQQEERKEIRSTIKEERKSVKEGRKERHKELVDLRGTLNGCKGQKTDACEAARTKVRGQVKENLKDNVGDVIEALNNLREKVSEATDLAHRDEALVKIDALLAKLTERQTKIEDLPENASTQELKETIKDVQDDWKETRHDLMVYSAFHANKGVHGVIVRAEKLETKLDATLERLKTRGYDTSAAASLVATFKTEISAAKEQDAKAKTSFEAARTDKTAFDQSVRDGYSALTEARIHLKNAQDALKEIVKAIKAVRDGEKTLTEEVAKKDEAEHPVNASVITNGSA
ncbi:hypothetical protein HZB00_04275 [Candidatus Woesearchaeota archaeon]|nr:hypothetical protein [Candidatus Woesearchaeota archaeon]